MKDGVGDGRPENLLARGLVRRLHPSTGSRRLGGRRPEPDEIPAAGELDNTGRCGDERHPNWPQYTEVFGGDLPTKIWATLMMAASADLPVEQFPPADPQTELGSTTMVPNVAGLDLASATNALTAVGFSPVQGEASRAAMLRAPSPTPHPAAVCRRRRAAP